MHKPWRGNDLKVSTVKVLTNSRSRSVTPSSWRRPSSSRCLPSPLVSAAFSFDARFPLAKGHMLFEGGARRSAANHVRRPRFSFTCVFLFLFFEAKTRKQMQKTHYFCFLKRHMDKAQLFKLLWPCLLRPFITNYTSLETITTRKQTHWRRLKMNSKSEWKALFRVSMSAKTAFSFHTTDDWQKRIFESDVCLQLWLLGSLWASNHPTHMRWHHPLP